MTSRRVFLAVLVALCVSLVPSSPAGASLIIDTEFRPLRDGFRFANWAGLNGDDFLSEKHMIQLLHDAGNCVQAGTDTYCDLRSGYRVTLDHLNEHLSAGRCEGMAILAARLFKHSTKLVHLSRRAHRTYDLTRKEAADEIALWWATQLAPNIQLYSASKRVLRPSDIATEITRRLRNKVMITMGIYWDDYAHTVLVTKATVLATRTVLTVYDPNFPGQTRKMSIDMVADTWTYARALGADGTLVTLSGKGAGGLDYAPTSLRSHLSAWERLGGF